MEPAHNLINVYFDMKPFEETKEKYRQRGLKCIDYWYNELKYILVDSLEFNEGPQYYKQKYGETLRICDMDTEDRTHILNAFILQLGMYPPIFPFSIKHFSLQPHPGSPKKPRSIHHLRPLHHSSPTQQ